MDLQNRSCTKAVSPLTITVDDDGFNEVGNNPVIDPCCRSIVTNAIATVETVKKPRTKWRKPEDKPHHPRTGYNFFFQLERERMLLGVDHLPISPYDVVNLQVGGSRVNSKLLLYQRDGSEHSIRPRALTGEKLGFADLARNIASKWKTLDGNIKLLFEEKADLERARYKRELEVWNEQQKSKTKQQKVSQSCSLAEVASSASDGNKFSTPSKVTIPSKAAPNNGLMASRLHASTNDQQRASYTPTNCSQQSDVRDFRQDQMNLKKNQFDCGVGFKSEAWPDSPFRSNTDDLEEKLLWKLTRPKVISPPESSVRSTTLNFYPENNGGPNTANGHSSMNDLSSKINHFIGEVCCVSEELHDLAKRGTLDQRLPLPLREIESQVDFCISEIRRLSSQIRDFERFSRDELIDNQYLREHSQLLQAKQNSKDLLRNQLHHKFDIPSLMKEVSKVQHTLDCSDRQIGELLENRKRLLHYELGANVMMNDNRKTFRIKSDSTIIQPSPRRVSDMNESHQLACNMNVNSFYATDNISAFESVDDYRSVSHTGMAGSQRRVQAEYVASRDFRNQDNVRNQGIETSLSDNILRPQMLSKRVVDDRQGNFSHKIEISGKGTLSDIIQRRQLHPVQTDMNGLNDGKFFAEETAIDAALDFCDDDTAFGNMDCDAAFDMESIFAPYSSAV